MTAQTGYARRLLLVALLFATTAANAQDELRNTFFKDADAAKAAAEAADASLFAPRNFERGMKEYRDAEVALERGRNIGRYDRTLLRRQDISGQRRSPRSSPRRRSRKF